MKPSLPSSRRALLHPLFWAALIVLVVNDHLLKEAHVLPPLVTGKLSDFAGMLVAPVLLTSLLRGRGNRGRLTVFVLIAAGFAAIKLSRPCADLVETIAAPLRWRIWCDPTDLLALSMLPVAWRLSADAEAPASHRQSRRRSCLRAAGVVLGLFACAATSSTEETFSGTAFLFNGTMRTQTLRLYRLQAPLDCARPLDDPATWPGADAFVLSSCPTLLSRDVLGLDRGWRAVGGFSGLGDFHVDPKVPPDSGLACDAVLLESDGLSPVVITWNGVAPVRFSGTEYLGEKANDEHGLVLEQAGDRLFIAGTSLLRVLPAGFEPAPADCPNGER